MSACTASLNNGMFEGSPAEYFSESFEGKIQKFTSKIPLYLNGKNHRWSYTRQHKYDNTILPCKVFLKSARFPPNWRLGSGDVCPACGAERDLHHNWVPWDQSSMPHGPAMNAENRLGYSGIWLPSAKVHCYSGIPSIRLGVWLVVLHNIYIYITKADIIRIYIYIRSTETESRKPTMIYLVWTSRNRDVTNIL